MCLLIENRVAKLHGQLTPSEKATPENSGQRWRRRRAPSAGHSLGIIKRDQSTNWGRLASPAPKAETGGVSVARRPNGMQQLELVVIAKPVLLASYKPMVCTCMQLVRRSLTMSGCLHSKNKVNYEYFKDV